MVSWLRHPAVWVPISAILLVAVVWRSELWTAGDRLGRLDPAPLVAAVLVGGVVLWLWAVRSADLLAGAGRPVGVVALVPMTAFANTINNLTPGSMGELVRMYLLRAHHGVDYTTGAAVILIERVVAVGYLTLSALLLWLAGTGAIPGGLAVVLVALLVAGPFVVYRLGVRPTRLLTGLPLGRLAGARWARVSRVLARIDETIARLLGHPVRVSTFAATTAGVFAVNTAQLVLVGRALGVALDPVAAWGALGLSITVGVISLLPFGLGSSDLALVALLGFLGLDPAVAAAVAFGYRLVATLPYAIAGIASYAFLSARLPAPEAGGVAAAARAVDAALDEADGR
jgi:uncharacterized protein (TIRG00374 family)